MTNRKQDLVIMMADLMQQRFNLHNDKPDFETTQKMMDIFKEEVEEVFSSKTPSNLLHELIDVMCASALLYESIIIE
jgi:hypothetical protein